MRNLILKYIFWTSLFFFPLASLAQRSDDFMKDEEKQQDKPKTEVKPEVKLWHLSGYGAFQDSVKLDTLLEDYHLYNPVFKNLITATYLGNYGLAYLNNNFFERKSDIDFYFLKDRDVYLLTPEKLNYYNTRTPYSVLDYSQSESKSSKSEMRFNVLHTQNVNPYLNFTFRWDQARSDGQYNYQDTKNNLVSLYSNYNKDALKIHGGFIANSIQNSENGGITADSLLLKNTETEYLTMNLEEASAKYSNTVFFATAEYRLGKYEKKEAPLQPKMQEDIPPKPIDNKTKPSNIMEGGVNSPSPNGGQDAQANIPQEVFRPILGVMYSAEYQRNYRQFVEDEDSTNTFFSNTYYGDNYTKDSVHFNKFSHVFQLKQYENTERKTSFGKRAFIGQEFVRLSYPSFVVSSSYNHIAENYSNTFIGGGIFRETGNFWTWNAEGKLYLLGRNIGQTELSATISKPIHILGDSLSAFTINGKIENLVPDYFQEEYFSNHIRWRNNLAMEQNMTVKGMFSSPKYNLQFGANYSVINNFIYNDEEGIPTQSGNELFVVGAFVNKDFTSEHWNLRTKLLYQKTSDASVLHLPDFSGFVSAYYKLIVSKVLYTQLGVDLRYYTSFYSDAYSPATGLFHIQNETKTGNYPYIDAHANLRLKRTRFFFKLMNIGTTFINREYYTTPHYPMNRMTFRFGVAWVFYD